MTSMRHSRSAALGPATLVSAAMLGSGLIISTSDALAQPTVIEEIIVTAQKREQNVNDVPIAISAYSQQIIQSLGIRSTEELESLTPGLEVNNTGGVGTKTYTIRGVGFNDYSTGASSTVGLYFNEVSVPYTVMSTRMFFDIDRIEVAKGPQGYLYGRNTTAGHVSIYSRKPTSEFEAGFNAGISSYETFDFSGYLSGPLSDYSRGRIALATTQSGEGWQESLSRPGDKLGELDKMAVRGSIDWDIADNLNLLFNLHYNDDQSDNLAPTAFDGTLVGLEFPTRRGPIFNTQGELEQFVIFSTDDNEAADWTNGPANALRPRRDNQLSGLAARVTWEIGKLQFVSVTGYDEFERNEANDWDGTDLLDSSNINTTDLDVFSQEFRLSGYGDRFVWLAGIYYSEDELSEIYNYYFGEGRFGINQVSTRFVQDTDSIAGFGHLEWDITGSTGLLLGLRYTSENRDWSGCTYDATPPNLSVPGVPLTVFLNNIINGPGVLTPNGLLNDGFNFPNGLPAVNPLAANECGTFNDLLNTPGAGQYGVFSDSISADELMWKVGIDHRPNEDVLLFGSISKSFKSGGFNGANSNTHSQLVPYDIENLLAYEVGVKATIVDGSMQLNASVFFYDYEDKQEREAAVTPVGNLSGLANIPESEIIGAEADMLWLANDRLTISAGVSFLDTEIKEWFPVDNEASMFPNTVLFDASGAELPNAPPFSGNLSAAYEFDVGPRLLLTPAFDVIYRGETSGDIMPENEREDYTLVNLRFTLEPQDADRWSLQLWARNLLDEDYFVSGQVGGNFTVTRSNGMPRTFGVNVDMQF